MLLAAHITVGAALGSSISNPVLAILSSFISHYFIDCIPHWDPARTDNKKRQWIFFIVDVILSIGLVIFFSTYLAQFINSNFGSINTTYSFQLSMLKIGSISFSPVILLCCFAAILPKLPVYFSKITEKFKLFQLNKKLKHILHNEDKGFMGRFIQIATIVVFGLYSFRLIPNSDSDIFYQIIILILIIILLVATIETFFSEPESVIEEKK